MDKIESLAGQLSQVTMYDIKSMYNQAKNIVLNVSEMEAKVRDATNDDPWGASSTLMTEIAQGTFNFQQFNEIMPCIYSRFMEKEASQWRQIYKALQLLEYLIKHGSERVVDDARSHLSTIKMLRNFHYIDDTGKDQGINVRNRAKEISEMLSDLDRIRQERRKAKANRSKYIGTGNDGLSFASATGSRYGGFGSEEVGASSGYGGGYDRGDYGSGGGGGSRSGGFQDETSRKGFEEYDAGDDDDRTDVRRSDSIQRSAAPRTTASRRTAATDTSSSPRRTAAATSAPPKAKVMDLLGFDDDDSAAAPPIPPANTTKHAAAPSLDDEFDDFQSATPVSNTPAPAVQPAKPTAQAKTNVFDLLGSSSTATQSTAASRTTSSFAPMTNPPMAAPMGTQSSFASFGGGPQVKPQSPMGFGAPMSPVSSAGGASRPNYFGGAAPLASTPPIKPATPYATKPTITSGGTGAFEDLWSMGLGSSTTKPIAPGGHKSIKDLEREKQQAAIWGAGNAGGARPPPGFGGFSNNAPSSSGGDDLLL